MTIKNLLNVALITGVAVGTVSCKKDSDNDTTPPAGQKVYALGIGVTTTTATTNYVVQTSDLMSGTVSLAGNGLLQDGYRDYAYAGSKFFSIGGLGITDVNTLSLNASDKLTTQTGLTFELQNNELIDIDGTGKTMVGASLPTGPTVGLNAKFYTVDVASNTVANKVDVPMNNIHPSSEDWLFHTGMQVRGNQMFQTFYPVNAATYETKNTDYNYVAIYSYPGFVLQKVIKDSRTGPSGAFNTRSGLFKTESGDLYAVSNSSFSNGYSQSTKPAGILKIASGATEFDANYFFNTDAAANGGKIAHAIYIGNGKLFAEITTKVPTAADRWSDANLRLAIVDLNAKTVTPVTNSPVFSGNGGRSFAATTDEGKVYCAITVAGVMNIYQTDIATATATKGATIEGTFLGGIARLK
ncbi:DUF4374 domain-containing protein [Pedobacter sp. HMF7647]|uniref:DUF4374 domain-containing protein n=1 Tax=Hufsiella arboris TaxID=2695275 RepID=A0A7K1YCY5_9SPHI|nr:DUF4374 domain-containing protein [Hufsiella arboris]MXV51959.1 DUF4374 domain-containing protein [Hufsiella arboris]